MLKIYGQLLTYFISLSLIVSSTPVVANTTLEIEANDSISGKHLLNLEDHLDHASKQKEVSMDLTTFEKKLDHSLLNLQKRMNHNISKMKEQKALKRYNAAKKTIMAGQNEILKSDLSQMDAGNYSAKEKLLWLNSNQEHNQQLKNTIMKQVRAAGSVKAFIKQIKQALVQKRMEAKTNNDNDWEGIIDAIYTVLAIIAIVVMTIVLGPMAAITLIATVLLQTIAGFIVVVLVCGFIIWLVQSQEMQINETHSYQLN